MSNIRRRLKKLEASLTDSSRLVRDSEEWFAYWEKIFEGLVAGETPTFPGRIPLAAIDRMIEQADREDEQSR
jgi:hypothetical protein